MTLAPYTKGPSDYLDYGFDLSAWLESGDTIASATGTVPDGITGDNETVTNTVAAIWLSGGIVGQTYTLTCKITTTDGRVKSFILPILITNT